MLYKRMDWKEGGDSHEVIVVEKRSSPLGRQAKMRMSSPRVLCLNDGLIERIPSRKLIFSR